MRTREEVQAEADKVDALIEAAANPLDYDILVAMRDALQWVLGVYPDKPTSPWEA